MKWSYPCERVNGHVIVTDGDARLLIDTGAPSSMGDRSPLVFASEEHDVPDNFMGVSPASLSDNVGSPVNAVVGMDILNRYDIRIDPSESVIVCTDEALDIRGMALSLDAFMGIPILQARVGGTPVHMFFDTGAKLSYLDPDICRDAVLPVHSRKSHRAGDPHRQQQQSQSNDTALLQPRISLSSRDSPPA